MTENNTDEGDSEPKRDPLKELTEQIEDDRSSEKADEGFEAQPVGEHDQTDEEVLDSFEEQDVEEVDDLWERIEEGAGEPSNRGDPSDDHTTVVPKHEFCAGCPHLNDPVEMGCTHPTAEIIELVDVETVRVRNCPFVTE